MYMHMPMPIPQLLPHAHQPINPILSQSPAARGKRACAVHLQTGDHDAAFTYLASRQLGRMKDGGRKLMQDRAGKENKQLHKGLG